MDHPERLDYDYEHIYALVTRRVVEAKAKAEVVKVSELAKALRKEVWKMHTEKLDGGNASPSEIAVTFEKWQRLMGDNDREKKAGLPSPRLSLYLPRQQV